jgi:acyl-CoA thioester hydrolase
LKNQVYTHRHRVTYHECTVGNHVYYARYLDILEEARGEFFRSLGRTLLEWQEADVIFPVIEVRVRYKASARYDDEVTVELWLGQFEGVRVSFAYRLVNQHGQLLAEATTFHVIASLKEKPRRPPPDLSAQLGPFLQVNSDGETKDPSTCSGRTGPG